MGFFDQAGKKFSAVQKLSGDSISARRLQAQVRNIEFEIRRMYAAVGEKCYKANAQGSTPEGLDKFYASIATLHTQIAEIQAKLDRLNNVVRCEACNTAVARGLRFCPNCGTQTPAPEVETCPDCSTVRCDNACFCVRCGHRFEIPADSPVVENSPSEATE